MKTGVYYDMPMADYLDIKALSASGVEHLVKGGKWGFYKHCLDPARERKETDSLSNGELLHTFILEPERWNREYLVGPNTEDKRKKEWQDAKKIAESTGKSLLHPNDIAWLNRCLSEIKIHPFANSALLGEGKSEVTVVWEWAGNLCKARFDRLLPKIGIDLKTTRDASDRGFVRESWTYRYDVKAAWYLAASRAFAELGQSHFGFVAVEIEYPSLVNVFVYEYSDLAIAERDILQAMNLYRDGLNNGWEREDRVIKRLELPKWAIKQREEDYE